MLDHAVCSKILSKYKEIKEKYNLIQGTDYLFDQSKKKIEDSNYLGRGAFSTVIKLVSSNNESAYKIIPLVCVGEEYGLSPKEHLEIMKQELYWQLLASAENKQYPNGISPEIFNYGICSDTEVDNNCKNEVGEIVERKYFIIEMKYLQDYIDINDYREKYNNNDKLHVKLDKKLSDIINEKHKRNLPNISDGHYNGVQAMIKVNKKGDDIDDIKLIDWGNAIDYDNNIKKLMKAYPEKSIRSIRHDSLFNILNPSTKRLTRSESRFKPYGGTKKQKNKIQRKNKKTKYKGKRKNIKCRYYF